MNKVELLITGIVKMYPVWIIFATGLFGAYVCEKNEKAGEWLLSLAGKFGLEINEVE